MFSTINKKVNYLQCRIKLCTIQKPNKLTNVVDTETNKKKWKGTRCRRIKTEKFIKNQSDGLIICENDNARYFVREA